MRPFPRGEDGRHLIDVIEWVLVDPEPEQLDPETTGWVRRIMSRPLGGNEEAWRTALDLALVVWKKGYDKRQVARRRVSVF